MRSVILIVLLLPIALFAQQAGGERNQWQLNPELSVLGDVLVAWDEPTGETEASVREVEFSLQAALDPYTRMKVFVGLHQEHHEEDGREEGEHHHDWAVDLEEAYVTWTGLGRGVALDAGKFKQPFGQYNRWHPHALPGLEYPLYIRAFFGEEGLASTGLSVDWLFSGLGTDQLTLQGFSHGGENAFLGHARAYWDLTPALYLEAGASYLSLMEDAWGADLTLQYQPPSRARYAGTRFHAEWGRRGGADGWQADIDQKLSARWSVGLLAGHSQVPGDEDRWSREAAAIFSWWQSEFVRLRLHVTREEVRGEDFAFGAALQMTFAAGPHKHDSY